MLFHGFPIDLLGNAGQGRSTPTGESTGGAGGSPPVPMRPPGRGKATLVSEQEPPTGGESRTALPEDRAATILGLVLLFGGFTVTG